MSIFQRSFEVPTRSERGEPGSHSRPPCRALSASSGASWALFEPRRASDECYGSQGGEQAPEPLFWRNSHLDPAHRSTLARMRVERAFRNAPHPQIAAQSRVSTPISRGKPTSRPVDFPPAETSRGALASVTRLSIGHEGCSRIGAPASGARGALGSGFSDGTR